MAVTAAYAADLYWHRHRNTPRSHRLIKGVAVTATFPITGATLTMALAFLAAAHLAAAIPHPRPVDDQATRPPQPRPHRRSSRRSPLRGT